MQWIKIKSAIHQSGHVLEITFSDDHIESVDFSKFIFSTRHPDYLKYKSINEFLTFDIIGGNLNWDNYQMIFPISDLYNNKIVEHLK